MAYEALRFYSRRDLTFHFVSNVDSTDLVEALRGLEADETLFIILENFRYARDAHQRDVRAHVAHRTLGDESAVAKHFVAVSTNAEKVAASNRHRQHVRVLGLGGRSLLDGIGHRPFDDDRHRSGTLRRAAYGFHAMDEHFDQRPSRELPVLMGLLALWNRDFLGCASVGVMPYEQYLKRLPAYLQQLTMESNGKHVTLDGTTVDYDTGALYWGEPGTNGQHSFYK